MIRKTTASETSTAVQTRVINILLLGLGVLSVYFLSRAVLAVLAPESLWEPPELAPPAAVMTNTNASAKIDLRFDPFHRDSAPIDEVIEIGTDAPETTLNLKLVGRRAGRDGSAILETPDRSQNVFRIGDEIMNGVTLKAVHPGYIVLSQGGRIERLTFERDSDSGLLAERPQPKEQAPTEIKTIPKSMTISRFMAGVNLAPVINAGQMRGYRLTPKNGSVDLRSLGLRSGDVVTSISGMDLTSPNLNPADLAAKLSGRSQLRLNVLRGTETVFINIGNP